MTELLWSFQSFLLKHNEQTDPLRQHKHRPSPTLLTAAVAGLQKKPAPKKAQKNHCFSSRIEGTIIIGLSLTHQVCRVAVGDVTYLTNLIQRHTKLKLANTFSVAFSKRAQLAGTFVLVGHSFMYRIFRTIGRTRLLGCGLNVGSISAF